MSFPLNILRPSRIRLDVSSSLLFAIALTALAAISTRDCFVIGVDTSKEGYLGYSFAKCGFIKWLETASNRCSIVPTLASSVQSVSGLLVPFQRTSALSANELSIHFTNSLNVSSAIDFNAWRPCG